MHLTPTDLAIAAIAAATAALSTPAHPQSAQPGPAAMRVVPVTSLALSAPPPPTEPLVVAQAAPPATSPRPARSQQATAERAAGDAVASGALRPCTNVTVDQPTQLTLGKSQVVRLPFPVSRLIVGGQGAARAGRPAGAPQSEPPPPGLPPQAQARIAGAAQIGRNDSTGVADTEVTLLSPTELFFLGRRTGSMNVILQANDGRCLVKDLVVTVDPGTLQATLKELMPDETGLRVRGAEDSLVLTGSVSDALKLQQVMAVASSYADNKKVVNLMSVAAPQQVMLEVQIAEVSKNLLDRLGSAANIRRVTDGGNNTFSLISDFLTSSGGLVQALRKGHTSLAIDAQMNDGVVRVLAEPNIMAISGQTASFLSGGKIFIPVANDPSLTGGFARITLEEKEFGVGLKFTPTVLNGRVNLKVTSEVSELSQTGTPFATIGNVTAILPSMTTRRVDTTVQLADGQSFVVAGLIKNNVTEAVKKFPGLGEAPIVGALFRSTEFQRDLTELMFVVTPRLVRPITGAVTLPTDNHVVPSRRDVMLNGANEGPDTDRPPAAVQQPQPAPAPAPVPAPAPGPSSGLTPAPLVTPVPDAEPVQPRPLSMLGLGGIPLTAP